MLQFMGLRRVRHDLVTEQQQQSYAVMLRAPREGFVCPCLDHTTPETSGIRKHSKERTVSGEKA